MAVKRIARIAEATVPSIFEGAPKHLFKIKSPRKMVRRQACHVVSATCTRGNSSGKAESYSPAERATAKQSGADIANKSCDINEEMGAPNQSPFQEIFSSASSVCLSMASWAVHWIDTEELKDIGFRNACVLHSSNDEPCVLFNRKSVYIKINMSVQEHNFSKPFAFGLLFTVGFGSFAILLSEAEGVI